MTATLELLEARLTVLEDKEAIRLLKSRYLRACDLKHPELIRDCFVPCGARIAYDNFPEFSDRDSFVAVFEQMACQGGVYDLHHATNWEIDLVGLDRATGKWSLSFRSVLLAQRQVVRLAVEYEDVYVRQDGRWWISESVSRVTSALVEQVNEDGTTVLVNFAAQPSA